MAKQRDKVRPDRAIAEQPTHPVELSSVTGSDAHVTESYGMAELDEDGPTIDSSAIDGSPEALDDEARSGSPAAITLPSPPPLPPSAASAGSRAPEPEMPPRPAPRDLSRTQSGAFGTEPGPESTMSLEELEALPELAAALNGHRDREPRPADEPTRALDADRVAAAPRLEPTSSLPWPPTEVGPAAEDVIAGQYRIEAQLNEEDGCRLFRAADADGRPVVLRTYVDSEAVRRKARWQQLREAFEGGAPLPALLTARGVTPVYDLVEDAQYGPVVVTAWLAGGTLAERASVLDIQRLIACFEQVARVLMEAHAVGVTCGRWTAADVVFDADGVPHLDLSVAAFADALDVRPVETDGPPEGGAPSASGDVWWLGHTMVSCLTSETLEPGADVLDAIAQDCLKPAEGRPTAAEVCHRLQTTLAPTSTRPRTRRWPTVALLSAGIVGALAVGWVAGGGLSGSRPVVVTAAPDVAKALSEAESALAAGAWLQAGRLYRTVLATSDDPRAVAGWRELQASRPFRRSLKDLKKRLATAEAITPAVRRDVEMLRVLQPESLVLKHWLRRLDGVEGDRP